MAVIQATITCQMVERLAEEKLKTVGRLQRRYDRIQVIHIPVYPLCLTIFDPLVYLFSPLV